MAGTTHGMLGHPAFCGAVALVAVNDHVLKARWPGLVTGKLSDVAGVFAATVVAALLLRSSTHAAALVAVAFSALKLSPAVAQLAAPMLGGVTRRDPTDLIALVAVWPAAMLVERQGRLGGGVERRHERLAVFGSAALTVAAVTATVLTTTATSCERDDGVSAFVVTPNGEVAAELVSYGTTWYRSADGGASWTLLDVGPTGSRSSKDACLDDRCLRVDDTTVQERLGGGDWTLSFTFTKGELDNMDDRTASDPGCHMSLVNQFASVASFPFSGHRVDLVAMGTEGALRRIDGGAWRRIAVGDAEPTPTTPRNVWPARLTTIAALALLALFGVVPLVARRGRRLAAFAFTIAASGAALVFTSVATLVAGIDHSAVVVVPVAVLATSVAFWFARRRSPQPIVPPPWPPPLPPR